jgi:hypothetical protein
MKQAPERSADGLLILAVVIWWTRFSDRSGGLRGHALAEGSAGRPEANEQDSKRAWVSGAMHGHTPAVGTQEFGSLVTSRHRREAVDPAVATAVADPSSGAWARLHERDTRRTAWSRMRTHPGGATPLSGPRVTDLGSEQVEHASSTFFHRCLDARPNLAGAAPSSEFAHSLLAGAARIIEGAGRMGSLASALDSRASN